MIIDLKANEQNIKTFKAYGIRDSEKKRYKCVLCGKKTSIDSSFSNNGSRLICWSCAHKYFNKGISMWSLDTQKLFDWMGEVSDDNSKS